MGCGASVGGQGEAPPPAAAPDGEPAGTRAGPGDAPMATYPLEFASEAMSLAREAGLLAAGDEAQQAEIDESFGLLKGMGVLDEAGCQQLKDMALAECGQAAAEILRSEPGAGGGPPASPAGVAAELWKRTWEMCVTSGRWACAEQVGDGALAAKEKKAFQRHARAIKGFGPGKGPKDPGAFASRATEVMPANVIMFSGCMDEQTSADVQNTASFGLPADAGPGGAGGACTNAMIKALNEQSEDSWAGLLKRMRGILSGKYTQIPQLSSSKAMDLNTPFSVRNPQPSGKYRALLVGINYVGTNAELAGCHNDVETMKRYLLCNGYTEDCMRILLDDGQHDRPSKADIEQGMSWLVEGADVGDSLFFHYSGHGASVKDDDSDEADGKDEALCPCDYNSAGLIRDDEVFQFLVAPLKEGVSLTCVLDCCHSGTILDLPYMFKADDASLAAVDNGSVTSMMPNPGFDFGKVLQVMKDHPALCVGAVALGGAALLFMGSEHRSKAISMVGGVAGGQDQLIGMVTDKLGLDPGLVNMAKGFLG